MDIPIHYRWWRASGSGGADGRTEGFARESVAGVGSVLHAGDVLAVALFFVQPHPLPTLNDLKEMRWWAPLGGIVGAVAVFAGLTLVQKVGVGTLNGLTICANLLASIAIDHFALVGVPEHPLSWLRALGAVLMFGGVALVMRF